MESKSKNGELGLFIILTSLFIAALGTCNLIANKFVSIDLGFKTFIVSAGILPYPITFLITDILSEMGHEVTLIEKSKSPGGMCKSYYKDGFTYEYGPHIYEYE